MLQNEILLAAGGLLFGAATSAGTFALLVTLNIISRMAARTQTAGWILPYETMITLGGTAGCILSLFPALVLPGAGWMTVPFGLCAGIFVGAQAMALAEILNVFPILFRRIKLKTGLSWIMVAMAFGKLAGSLFYFMFGYQAAG